MEIKTPKFKINEKVFRVEYINDKCQLHFYIIIDYNISANNIEYKCINPGHYQTYHYNEEQLYKTPREAIEDAITNHLLLLSKSEATKYGKSN